MASQLSLDVDLPGPGFEAEVDLADAVLQAYGGDAERAIRELLRDADFLRGSVLRRLAGHVTGLRSWMAAEIRARVTCHAPPPRHRPPGG